MSGKKEKLQKKNRKAVKQTRKPNPDELSQKDLEKVAAAGVKSPRDAASGLS